MQKIALNFSGNFFGTSSHFLANLTGVGTLASILLANAFVIAGVVFVIIIIFGGIQMIGGAGKSPQEVARGREIILAALLGLIIIFVSYWIVRIIERSFGVNILG